jgi:hypothetical protein
MAKEKPYRSGVMLERPEYSPIRRTDFYLCFSQYGFQFGMFNNRPNYSFCDIAAGFPTLISPREFFREALRFGATTALAWHNHPSGDPTPSREDMALTTRLRSAGESLGVPLADHVVLGGDRWHSFRAAESWDRT